MNQRSDILPENKTCADCANKNYCAIFFAGFTDDSNVCGFRPHKFKVYESYGIEWEKEMMKLSKKILIELLKKAWKK